MGTLKKVIVNFSGGKDSTVALLETLKVYPKDKIIVAYENTGLEYLETPEHVRKITTMLDVELIELKPKLDFIGMVKKSGYFPRPNCRDCTDRLKKNPLRHWVAMHRADLDSEIIIVSGIRAEESKARAKLGEWCIDTTLTTKKQTVKLWAPCFNMTEKEVYQRIEAEGLPLHPCYEFARRCSCWACIFAPYNEVRNYAEIQPKLYEELCLLEDEVKHKWKPNFAINDLFKQGKLF